MKNGIVNNKLLVFIYYFVSFLKKNWFKLLLILFLCVLNFNSFGRMSDDGIIYNNELIEFIKASVEFTELSEKCRNFSANEFIDQSLEVLTKLYSKYLALPKIDESPDELIEKFVTEERWLYIHNLVAGVLQDKDEIVELQDSSIERSIDYIKVSLSELYADIYQDLGDMVYAYKLLDEQIIKTALYDCQQNFQSYWGIRLLTIIINLHRIKYLSSDSDL